MYFWGADRISQIGIIMTKLLKRDDEEIKYVLRKSVENDVKFIRLWFTDIVGHLKGVAVTVEELENALNRGMSFDGSSIEGFARFHESEMYNTPYAEGENF